MPNTETEQDQIRLNISANAPKGLDKSQILTNIKTNYPEKYAEVERCFKEMTDHFVSIFENGAILDYNGNVIPTTQIITQEIYSELKTHSNDKTDPTSTRIGDKNIKNTEFYKIIKDYVENLDPKQNGKTVIVIPSLNQMSPIEVSNFISSVKRTLSGLNTPFINSICSFVKKTLLDKSMTFTDKKDKNLNIKLAKMLVLDALNIIMSGFRDQEQ